MKTLPAMIDGRRGVVTKFFQDHHDEDWYIQASEYLKERRAFIQNRYIESLRYVDAHPENSDTFSYEFASILRDCGSAFSSVLDAVIKGSAFTNKHQTDVTMYRAFLKAQDATVYLYSVQFRRRFPYGLILPLYSLKNDANPKWWDAYNKVKHAEYNDFRSGNLGNATAALASLVILEVLLDRPRSDEIWTNIGSQYDEASVDMQNMKRLFPKSE